MSGDGSGRTYLDSVAAVFEQNHKDRQNRIQAQRVRDDVARAHSKYLQQNVVSPIEFRAARSTVAAWAKQHDVVSKAVKSDVKRLHHRNLFSTTSTSPAGKRRQSLPGLSEEYIPQSSHQLSRGNKFNNRPFLATIGDVSKSNESETRNVPGDVGNNLLKASQRVSPGTQLNLRDGLAVSTSNFGNVNQNSSSLTPPPPSHVDCGTAAQSEDWSSKFSNSVSTSCTALDLSSDDDDDGDNGDVVYLSDEEMEDGPFSCSVINCWAVFSRKEYLAAHMESSNHSPCNPAATLTDGQLVNPPQLYMCPLCGHSCQESMLCQEHMVMCDHLPLLPPLPVVAFACSQCLALFPDQVSCSDHISSQKHQEAAMPFKGDTLEATSPVPVPQSFAEELIRQSAAEPSTVRCVECDRDISAISTWQRHQRDYGQRHTAVSHSSTTAVDVVLKFLSDKACDACSQILYLSPGVSGEHHCADNLKGSAADMQVESFAEFVRRCSISSPKVFVAKD